MNGKKEELSEGGRNKGGKEWKVEYKRERIYKRMEAINERKKALRR